MTTNTTRVLAIIGAGTGISEAVARTFHDHGFTPALISRTLDVTTSLAADLDGRAYVADAANFDALRSALDEVRQDLGPIHTLLYNAAAPNWAPALSTAPEAFMHDQRVNVGGFLTAVQHVLPDLEAQTGQILVTGGGLALHPGDQAAALAAGKAAIRNLTFSLRAELAGRVNVGTVTVMGLVQDGTSLGPQRVADAFWQVTQTGVPEVQVG